MKASIEFVNHASVLISDGAVSLLSDPWFFGEVFHKAWSLLIENDEAYIRRLLERTDYIWISHEHPDHFSPPFFMTYRDVIRARNIRILFQKTLDGRVAAFFRDQGFDVMEIAEGARIPLSDDFSIRIVKSEMYDSALLATVNGQRIFNLNDCPIDTHEDLGAFVRRHGGCDVLLTQFSYAAWKGGREHSAWRRRAADSKKQTILRQIEHLKPDCCIPFASFVRFSNALNGYMNDEISRPHDIRRLGEGISTKLVFLRPAEVQDIAALRQDQNSLDYWEKIYDAALAEPLNEYGGTVDVEALRSGFDVFCRRIFQKNSRTLMTLAKWLLPLHPFGKTCIRLEDSGAVVRIDMLGNFSEARHAVADVEMHSASLDFIFQNEFGFDTLFVNGCFEEVSDGGFDRFAKCFAIGNLNSMGLYVGLSLLKRPHVIPLLLKKLVDIRRNMAMR